MSANILHESADDYFMNYPVTDFLLSGAAAVKVCLEALDNGLSVVRVEGGQWLNPGFEYRMDSIWDAGRDPTDLTEANAWNHSAAEFIRKQMQESPDPNMPTADAFIIVSDKLRGHAESVIP